MTDKHQTQCPHCSIKFQITAQQLSLAGGTVRCGSCLQVFQAGKNLLSPTNTAPNGTGSARGSARAAARAEPPAAKPATAKPPAAKPTPAARPTNATPSAHKPSQTADDDLADMILRELDSAPPPSRAHAAPQKAVAPPPRPSAPAEPQWAPPPKQPAAKPDKNNRHGVEENKLNISIGAGEFDSLLSADDEPTSHLTDQRHGRSNDHAGADESWAQALLGERPENEQDEKLRKFKIKADDLSMMDRTGVHKKSALQERVESLSGGGKDNNLPPPVQRTATLALQADDELDFLNESSLTMREVDLPEIDLDNFHEDTHQHTHQVSWGRDGFWGTLSAVFLLILAGQYLAFNVDTLARDSNWREIYSVICGAAGCTLPGNSDVNRIHGANLIIRSHPSTPHALIVDAVVYNRAPFAQPFPRLEIGFSDTQGNPLAGRIFSPAEYLSGELSSNDLMPPNTPIHLTLELVDPNTGAMNYEVRFLPPKAS